MFALNRTLLWLIFLSVTICTVGEKNLTAPPCSRIYTFVENNNKVNGYINLSLPSNLSHLDLSMKFLTSSPVSKL